MRRARVLAAVVVAALSLSVSAAAQDQGDLDDVRARLQRVGEELEAAEAAAAAAGQELADADARVAEIEAIVNEVAYELGQQESRVAAAQAELDALRAEAEAVQAAFNDRAVEMFKTSFGGDLEVIMSAQDIETAIDRSTLLQVINRGDLATVEQVQAAQGRVLTQQDELDLAVDRLTALQAEQEVILAEAEALRESRALAAASARARANELEHQEEGLEAEAAQIERLIRERSAPPPNISPPSVSGYVWPVCGQVTSEYGRRWGRQHAGIDINDNLTKAIVAAKGGVVIFTGWSGGYGNLTLIDHGDGVVTAYAHQSEIIVGEGQSVQRGQRIGTVGTTGNSTGTHLHFETRVNGSAVNPRQFLGGGC